MGDANAAMHEGQCFCGAVKFTATGEPGGMGYCHCNSCRAWSGAPVHEFSIWPVDAVEITAGADHVATFLKTPETISHRKYCKQCGGHLMIAHPSMGVFDILAVTLPTLKFVPEVHVNYAETVLPMKDGLPKFSGFPPEFGGPGELIPE